MLKKTSCFLLIVLLLVSCKSKSSTTKNSIKGLSVSKVIRNHYKNSFNQKTINARAKIKYKGKSDLPSVSASIRIKKDEVIWISLSKLGFPLGKVLITKDQVSYYEKINKTYFEGDFELLSNFLGTELDFKKVQNLLLGEAILNLRRERHNIELKDTSYELTPRKENDLFNILYLINSNNFKLNAQQIAQEEENKLLTIGYNNYEKVDNTFFPKKVLITAKESNYITTVDVEYKSVVFNKSVHFPFEIPEGYKEIELK